MPHLSFCAGSGIVRFVQINLSLRLFGSAFTMCRYPCCCPLWLSLTLAGAISCCCCRHCCLALFSWLVSSRSSHAGGSRRWKDSGSTAQRPPDRRTIFSSSRAVRSPASKRCTRRPSSTRGENKAWPCSLPHHASYHA